MQIPLNPFNRLEDLVPADWREPVDKRALFISAYELQGIPGSEFPGYVVCDLKDVRVLFWRGELSHREDVIISAVSTDSSASPWALAASDGRWDLNHEYATDFR